MNGPAESIHIPIGHIDLLRTILAGNDVRVGRLVIEHAGIGNIALAANVTNSAVLMAAILASRLGLVGCQDFALGLHGQDRAQV